MKRESLKEYLRWSKHRQILYKKEIVDAFLYPVYKHEYPIFETYRLLLKEQEKTLIKQLKK